MIINISNRSQAKHCTSFYGQTLTDCLTWSLISNRSQAKHCTDFYGQTLTDFLTWSLISNRSQAKHCTNFYGQTLTDCLTWSLISNRSQAKHCTNFYGQTLTDCLTWSLISNRSQFVLINVLSSIISTCDYGIPQGSVLGPLLFLPFINNIHEAIECSTIKLFAGDTNCFFSSYDFETLRETVVTEVCSIQQWINADKLTIYYDPKKSRFSVCKPLNRELPDTYKDDLFIHDKILKYKEHRTHSRR